MKYFARYQQALWLIGLVFAHAAVHANGIVRDSLGAVSSGRGGANLAHDDNLSIIHDNPSGLSWIDESLRLELSGDLLFPVVKYSDLDSSDRSHRGAFFLPQFSVAYRIPDSPVTLGLSACLPGGYGVEYQLSHSTYGTQKYASEGLLLKVLPTASVRLGDYVSIGGGIGFGYGSACFSLPYTFQSGSLAMQTGIVDMETDGFGITGNLGIQVRPTKRLTIGAAFVSETRVEQSGTFNLDVTGGPLQGLVTDPTAAYDVEHTLRWPRSVAVGASYEFDCGRLSGDVAWYNWSAAFDDITFNLSNGDNNEFNALAGPQPTDRFLLTWEDSVAVRVGYEHFVGPDSVVRCGYIFNQNPIPESTLTPLLPGTLEHSLCIGFGHRWGIYDLSVAYQYAFGSRQEVGQSAIIGGDFSSSTIRAQAHWLLITLAMRF